jgi:hypothetical protein
VTDILGWVFGIPLALLIIAFCVGWADEYIGDQKRLAGKLPRCGWKAPGTELHCYREPGHEWHCVTRSSNGRIRHWYGVNFTYDPVDGEMKRIR